jgi:hypothetical protein
VADQQHAALAVPVGDETDDGCAESDGRSGISDCTIAACCCSLRSIGSLQSSVFSLKKTLSFLRKR